MLSAAQEYGVRAVFWRSGAVVVDCGKWVRSCVGFAHLVSTAFEVLWPTASLVIASGIVVKALRLRLLDWAQAGAAVTTAPININIQQKPAMRAIHTTNSVHFGPRARSALSAIRAAIVTAWASQVFIARPRLDVGTLGHTTSQMNRTIRHRPVFPAKARSIHSVRFGVCDNRRRFFDHKSPSPLCYFVSLE